MSQGPIMAEAVPSGPPPRKRKGIHPTAIILAICGVFVLATIVLCGIGFSFLASTPKASMLAKEPFKYQDVPAPEMPPRGIASNVEGDKVKFIIPLGKQFDGYYRVPGRGGKLWLYMPKGHHPNDSLPCILFAPSGATAYSGMLLSDEDEFEILAYVDEGFCVIAYELDGPYSGTTDAINKKFKRAYKAFRASRAGLVNARNALQYLRDQVPQVAQDRIYAAGHSSAADTALLVAAHEPQIAGCIAFMPTIDQIEWLSPMYARMVQTELEDSVDFLVQSSPSTHLQRIGCPVFIFHAEDDDVVQIDLARKGVKRMRDLDVDVTFRTVKTGGHYDALGDHGLPEGIKWLKEIDAKRAVAE